MKTMAMRNISVLTAGLTFGLGSMPVLSQGLLSNMFHSSKTPLIKFVESSQYVPFGIPRSDWGVGTVLSSSQGREQIEEFNKDCLHLQSDEQVDKSKADVESSEAALSSLSYEVDRDASVDLNLARALGPTVDLKAAFSDSRVSKVRIVLKRPREWSTSTGRIKMRISQLSGGDSSQCVKDLYNVHNVIIFRVLSVDGLQYSFETSTGSAVKLDAQLLHQVGIKGGLAEKLSGSALLEVNSRVFIGYRAYQVSVASGIAETKIDLHPMSPREVLQWRQAIRQN